MKTNTMQYAAPLVYSVQWTARAFVSHDAFSRIPSTYTRAGIGWDDEPDGVRLRCTVSAWEVFATDCAIDREIYRKQADAARATLADFLENCPDLSEYRDAIEVDARPVFEFAGTVADVFRRLRDSEGAYGENRRALSEALRARCPFALLDLDYYTDYKIIAVGTAAEICDALDDQMKPATGIDDVIYKYLIIDSDGETVHKIPGEFYGVICADATASASLYTLDEEGEPDTLIWETVHSGSLYRCHRSTRFPLVVEWAGFDLFDDMAITCRREWEEYAAENGYTHAGGDTWEKAGSKFVLIEDERTPENCSACVCDIF